MNLSDLKRTKAFLVSALGVTIQPNGKAKCPFHSDDTPSLHIWNNAGNWFFKCHGCDAHGTVIDAFMLKYGLDSVFEAIKRMEADLGVKIIEDEDAIEPVIDQDRAEHLIKRAHDNLMTSFEIQEKFVFGKRGFRSLDIMEKYRIGFIANAVFKEWQHWHRFTCWVIPIRRKDGLIMGVKLHNELIVKSYEDAKIPKCLWAPLGTYPPRDQVKGTKPRNGTAMLWPHPDSFEVDEIYLCPGELKALGMEDNGFPATSITHGESGALPVKILNTIKASKIRTWIGMRDEDAAGNSWINGKELANGKRKKGIKEQIEGCGKTFYSISLSGLCAENQLISNMDSEKSKATNDIGQNFKEQTEQEGIGISNLHAKDSSIHDGEGSYSGLETSSKKDGGLKNDGAGIQFASWKESIREAEKLAAVNPEDQERNLLLERLRKADIVVSERDSIEDLRQAESVLEDLKRESQRKEVHPDWIRTMEENQKSFERRNHV